MMQVKSKSLFFFHLLFVVICIHAHSGLNSEKKVHFRQTSDWGEVRSSNRSSPHFFCEVWGEDPQFFLCEEWGEVPQFHCEVEEKRYSSLFLNSNAQMPQKGSFFFPFRQISGMYLWLRSQIHIANINFKDIGSPRHGYRGSR